MTEIDNEVDLVCDAEGNSLRDGEIDARGDREAEGVYATGLGATSLFSFLSFFVEIMIVFDLIKRNGDAFPQSTRMLLNCSVTSHSPKLGDSKVEYDNCAVPLKSLLNRTED